MPDLGFAIVGAGMIAGFHARAIRELEGARLRAVCSRDPARAGALAREHGADAATDLAAVLARRDVQVVCICTPSGAHLEPAAAAARAGKHVVVEKPIEVTLERADRVIAACRDAGVRLCAIFPSRFHEVSGLIKRAADRGRFGRLALASAYVKWWRSQAYYDTGGWKGTRALDGGGALMNQSIHAIDLLQWLAGPVTEVRALTACLAHERIEVEDTAVAALVFENGALGVIEGATSAWPGFLKRIELSGSRGSVILEEEDLLCWRFEDDGPDDERVRERFRARRSGAGGAADPAAIRHEPHRRQLQDLVDAIRDGRPPLVDGAEGRKALEIILAVYRSAVEGRPVRLPLAPSAGAP